MRLDGLLLFFFPFVKMQLKACVKSQEPIKILHKKQHGIQRVENAGPFNGKDQQKDVFFRRRRSAKARAVPNNLVPLAANKLFFCVAATMSILSVFSCLPYQSSYVTLIHHRKYIYIYIYICIYIIYVWEYCNMVTKSRHTKIFLHCL